MCCAWIAAGLIGAGYEPWNEETARIVERWRAAPHDAFLGGNSAAYLRETEQLADLEFILGHVDDLDAVFPVVDGEVVMAQPSGDSRR